MRTISALASTITLVGLIFLALAVGGDFYWAT